MLVCFHLLEVKDEVPYLLSTYPCDIGGKPISLEEVPEGGNRRGGDPYRFGALALGPGTEPVALNQVVEPGCPALPFNDSVNLLFEVGCHLVPLFAEAVGLLAKIPGFLPRDWGIRQLWVISGVASLVGFEPTTHCLEGSCSIL